jgi:two-component system OmpR family sensor kinase
MSATAWRPSRHRLWPELLWAAFVAANLVAVVLVPHGVTIPFHLIWISLTLLYGVQVWRLPGTLLALAAVMATTSAALAFAIAAGHTDPDEYSEIPLMALVFLGMVFHVRRRQAAVQEVEGLADERARLLEREHEFLSDASHQLRTPITVARGYAELIEQDCLQLTAATGADTAQMRADAGVVIDELQRLTRLSDGLLLLAAAERPEFLRLTSVSVDELVVEVAGRWRSVAPRRWTVEAASGASVPGDRERLRTALDALVDNAIAFTTDCDEITLQTGRDQGDVWLEVSDTGPGISPTIAARVFERFASDDAGRAAGRGTGLGLAAVRAVVLAHGGSVAAGNRPGGGAWFRLSLPTSSVGPPPPLAVPASSADTRAVRHARDEDAPSP